MPNAAAHRLRAVSQWLLVRWPYLVTTAAVAFAFHPTLRGTAHIPYDHEYFHFPLLRTVADMLADGSLPAWDPYAYGGTPLLANAQSAWAYPPHLVVDGALAAIGEPLTQRIVALTSVVHFWIAGMGMCLLVRERGLGDAAAAFAGAFVVLNGSILGQTQHLAQIEAFAWLPFALLMVDRLAEEVTARRVVALGVLFALMLTAGFTPVWVGCALVIGGYAVARFEGRLQGLAGAIGGMAAGSLIAAVFLLPIVLVLDHSIPPQDYNAHPLGSYISAIYPNAFGYWLGGPADAHYELGEYTYIGALAVLLIPLALTSGRAVIPVAALTAVMLFLAFGDPALRILRAIQDLPSGEIYRPPMIWFVSIVPLTLALAHGLARRPSRLQLAAAGAFLLFLLLLPVPNHQGRNLHLLSDAPRRELVVIAICAVLLAAAAAARGRLARWAPGVLALVAVIGAAELASAVPDRWFVNAPGPASRSNASGTNDGSTVVEDLRGRLRPDERVAVAALDLSAEWSAYPAVWSLQNTNGFQPQFSKYQLEHVQELGGDFRRQERRFPVSPTELPYFKELNARLVVVTTAADPFADRDGYTRVHQDGYYSVYRVDARMSRAWIADEACVERIHLIDATACAREPVAVTIRGERERELQVPRRDEERLVFTGEPHYPGWHASADGDSLPVRRHGYLSAVEVPPETERVTIEYRPPGLIPGLAISLIAILVSAALVVRARGRGRPAT